ncbi:MAG TPA: transketolase [Firmicutes bacterium]|jgi:transketolase|nr:transketolase [Bacillota bacterium]HAW69766.1 transketolase [Bacillota bacterium]HBE06909.1 transketolase [Bacillota bacterium]HBL51143.1 transketolase [Bacillota bacterium]HBL68414.1 transketolase [Bacillota bacterium]
MRNVLTCENEKELALRARNMRCHIIRMLEAAGSGHTGGSLSIVEIMALLYFKHMNIRPQEPRWPDRDRFVLSKGHAAPGLYAALCEAGFFPEDELKTLRKLGTRLQGHPDCKKVPGIDMSTGSLGQGLSAANGMALGLRLSGKAARVYTTLGDGESEEGQIWEAAMTAVHYKLDNLTAFLDHNGLQIDGDVTKVKSMLNPGARFQAFGWNVLYADGHNLRQLDAAIELAKQTKGVPTMIIAKTIKGKGVSFAEDKAEWHGVAPKADEAVQAIEEIMAGGCK